MKPTLYLAGKIAKNDWRHGLVPGLRGHLWADGPIRTDQFIYTGPFFVSCDHGCAHGTNTHGAVNTSCGGEQLSVQFTRHEVFSNNLQSLNAADLVFAYITATDCHGTMGELGYALALGKGVVLCFAPGIDSADFWFWATACHTVHIDVRECCLPVLLASALTDLGLHAVLPRQGANK